MCTQGVIFDLVLRSSSGSLEGSTFCARPRLLRRALSKFAVREVDSIELHSLSALFCKWMRLATSQVTHRDVLRTYSADHDFEAKSRPIPLQYFKCYFENIAKHHLTFKEYLKISFAINKVI